MYQTTGLSVEELLKFEIGIKEEISKRFRDLCDEAIEKADALYKGNKNDDYNAGGVYIQDYFDCIDDSVKSAFNPVWRKTLRMKSLISSGKKAQNESLEQNMLDAINYIRFMYACIKLYGLKEGGK